MYTLRRINHPYFFNSIVAKSNGLDSLNKHFTINITAANHPLLLVVLVSLFSQIAKFNADDCRLMTVFDLFNECLWLLGKLCYVDQREQAFLVANNNELGAFRMHINCGY